METADPDRNLYDRRLLNHHTGVDGWYAGQTSDQKFRLTPFPKARFRLNFKATPNGAVR